MTFKKAYKSIFSASKNLCISPQRQTWWPFSEVDVDQGSRSKIQTRVAAERAAPFPVVTFYKTKPSTVRGYTWFMAAWALGIPITRSRIGEPHYATQIQILTKSCSQFLFLSSQWKKQDRELNTWWRCGLYPRKENVGTGSVYSMRTWSIHVIRSSAMSIDCGPVFSDIFCTM